MCLHGGRVPKETDPNSSEARCGHNGGYESFDQLVGYDIPRIDVKILGWETLSWLMWRFYLIERAWKEENKGSPCPARRGVAAGACSEPSVI